MEKNTNVDEILFNVISNCDDKTKEKLLLRLYEEYDKYCSLDKIKHNKIDFLELQSSYTNIENKLFKIFNKNDDRFYDNSEFLNFINNKFILLKNLFLDLNITDKKSLKKFIYILTEMECLLKLPVTYKETLEDCIINNSTFQKKGRCKKWTK